MISAKYLVRITAITAGAITLWLVTGCSNPSRSLDNASTIPSQTEDKELTKKIII